MFSSGVWNREGADEMEKPAFVRLVSFGTMLSMILVAVGTWTSYTWQMTWPLLIATFLGMLAGVLIFTLVNNPGVSTIGVVIMSISAGLMIGPVVASYKLVTVAEAVIITGGIVGVMSVIGIMFPKVFEGWGPYLLAGLTVLIFSQFAQIICIALGFPNAANMPILAWVGIGIFTLYVAFDWSRALSLPLTADNAVDASGAIVLDAINIFLRVLQLLGGSSGNRSRK
jgi:FtsH-binding integral membrane protein